MLPGSQHCCVLFMVQQFDKVTVQAGFVVSLGKL